MPKPDYADSSPEAEKVFRDLRPLEQRPVSRPIMTVSFNFLYWGVNPAQLGHNRSSSPSATLANIAERKVPKHGSGQTQLLTQDMIRSRCI